MPRDATLTKEKLLRAGERLFAGRGVDGARVRDIVELAEQANDSAVSYHFGSRQGLLETILAKHIGHMEIARRISLESLGADGASTDLKAIVEAIVAPTAERLLSSDGRDFLRIIVQLSEFAGVRGRTVPAPIRGTALARQLDLLEDHCLSFLPEPIALERVATIIGLLTATLAERARRIEGRRRALLDHDSFVANLVEMIVAALQAPVPNT